MKKVTDYPSLTDYVRAVSLEDFGWEFKHMATWNKRLRTTGGRFFPKDGHLDFNPTLYYEIGDDEFRRIVRHELCHYHLYFQKRGYRHKNRDFKNLLAKVDGLRFAPSIQSNRLKHLYRCTNCGQLYPRQRRINLLKFACGKCRGKLEQLS